MTTGTKICRSCGDNAEHYACIATMCKECWKARVRGNRARNADHYRAFDVARGKTPKRKAAFAEKLVRMRAENPDMVRAHNAIARAIKRGDLVRPTSCQHCGKGGDIEAHHDDHARELDVLWLCPVCHAQRHRELGRLNSVAKIYGPDLKLGF